MKQLRQRYVWIFTGNDIDSWSFSISNCTKEEIFQAAHGHIMIDSSYKKKQSFINPNMVNLFERILQIYCFTLDGTSITR